MDQLARNEQPPIFSLTIKNFKIIEKFQEGKIDFKIFGIIGVEEFSMDEAEVDLILGEAAYCGGDPDADLLEKIENYYSQNLNSSLKIYFINYENCFYFINWFNQQIQDTSMFDLNNEYKLEKVEDIDWVEKWKINYRPLTIGNDILILPDFLAQSEDVQDIKLKKLIIKPGRGFGTGTHETTQLCLENFLEFKNVIPDGVNILDFGCGSGILGIGAKIFKNNSKLELFDIDPNALENASENLSLNPMINHNVEIIFFEDKLKIEKNGKKFLIFANILLPILKAEMEFILNSIDNEFILIMSGVLISQTDELISIYQDGFRKRQINPEVKIYYKNDWASVVFFKVLH